MKIVFPSIVGIFNISLEKTTIGSPFVATLRTYINNSLDLVPVQKMFFDTSSYLLDTSFARLRYKFQHIGSFYIMHLRMFIFINQCIHADESIYRKSRGNVPMAK